MRRFETAVWILFIILAISNALSYDSVFLREDFNSLDNWKPLYFPKIKAHTKYSIATAGGSHYLKAESNASASAVVNTSELDIQRG
jgi:hypothetical protein